MSSITLHIRGSPQCVILILIPSRQVTESGRLQIMITNNYTTWLEAGLNRTNVILVLETKVSVILIRNTRSLCKRHNDDR